MQTLGCTVYLLTVEKLRKGNWPREAIDEMFFMPEELPLQDLLNAVSYAARSRKIDRIVALDEFDLENVAAIREHLRLPGMGLTTVHYFRDKLAMRMRAREAGILVPEFIHVLNHENLSEFMMRVPGPWLLKPRAQASGIGMKKINESDELWPWLEQLGDKPVANTCWNNLFRAGFFTWTGLFRKRRFYLPKHMPTGCRRWTFRITAEFSLRGRCRAIRKMRWRLRKSTRNW